MDVPTEQIRISGERLVALHVLSFCSKICVASESRVVCCMMYCSTSSMIEHISKFAFVAVFANVRSSLFNLAMAVSGLVDNEADGLAKMELVITSRTRRLFHVRKLGVFSICKQPSAHEKLTVDPSLGEKVQNTDQDHVVPKHVQLWQQYPGT